MTRRDRQFTEAVHFLIAAMDEAHKLCPSASRQELFDAAEALRDVLYEASDHSLVIHPIRAAGVHSEPTQGGTP